MSTRRWRGRTRSLDGSLYEKMPGFAVWLQAALDELAPGKLSTMLSKVGSGLGAAIPPG